MVVEAIDSSSRSSFTASIARSFVVKDLKLLHLTLALLEVQPFLQLLSYFDWQFD